MQGTLTHQLPFLTVLGERKSLCIPHPYRVWAMLHLPESGGVSTHPTVWSYSGPCRRIPGCRLLYLEFSCMADLSFLLSFIYSIINLYQCPNIDSWVFHILGCNTILLYFFCVFLLVILILEVLCHKTPKYSSCLSSNL